MLLYTQKASILSGNMVRSVVVQQWQSLLQYIQYVVTKMLTLIWATYQL